MEVTALGYTSHLMSWWFEPGQTRFKELLFYGPPALYFHFSYAIYIDIYFVEEIPRKLLLNEASETL